MIREHCVHYSNLISPLQWAQQAGAGVENKGFAPSATAAPITALYAGSSLPNNGKGCIKS